MILLHCNVLIRSENPMQSNIVCNCCWNPILHEGTCPRGLKKVLSYFMLSYLKSMYILWFCWMQRKYPVNLLLYTMWMWKKTYIFTSYLIKKLCGCLNSCLKCDHTNDLSPFTCETLGGKRSISMPLPTAEGGPMRTEKLYDSAPRAVGCVNTEKSPRRIGQTDGTQELALLAWL